MKPLLLSFFVGTAAVCQAQEGFFSINTQNNHLVLVEPVGTVTDIGPTGHDMNYYSALAFNNGILYGIFEDSLCSFNTTTGAATVIAPVRESVTGDALFAGKLAFTSKGEAFAFQELSEFAEGSLYRLNIQTGIAARVSANTSGDYSILGIAFDQNDNLYGVSEYGDNLLMLDTISGEVSYDFPMCDMDFGNALNFIPSGVLWGIDINNEYTFDYTRYCTFNIQTGESTEQFRLSNNYAGLAWGTYSGIASIKSAGKMLNAQLFPNPGNGNFTVRSGGINDLSKMTIRITDLTGRSCDFNLAFGQNEFSVTTALSKGMYQLSVSGEGIAGETIPFTVE